MFFLSTVNQAIATVKSEKAKADAENLQKALAEKVK
jgi:hypothetical protein